MSSPTTILYIGPKGRVFDRFLTAAFALPRAEVQIFRTDSVRPLLGSGTLDARTVCVVDSSVRASALLQLVSWARITGEGGSIVALVDSANGRPRRIPGVSACVFYEDVSPDTLRTLYQRPRRGLTFRRRAIVDTRA